MLCWVKGKVLSPRRHWHQTKKDKGRIHDSRLLTICRHVINSFECVSIMQQITWLNRLWLPVEEICLTSSVCTTRTTAIIPVCPKETATVQTNKGCEVLLQSLRMNPDLWHCHYCGKWSVSLPALPTPSHMKVQKMAQSLQAI